MTACPNVAFEGLGISAFATRPLCSYDHVLHPGLVFACLMNSRLDAETNERNLIYWLYTLCLAVYEPTLE